MAEHDPQKLAALLEGIGIVDNVIRCMICDELISRLPDLGEKEGYAAEDLRDALDALQSARRDARTERIARRVHDANRGARHARIGIRGAARGVAEGWLTASVRSAARAARRARRPLSFTVGWLMITCAIHDRSQQADAAGSLPDPWADHRS